MGLFDRGSAAPTDDVPPPANAPLTVKTADVSVRNAFLRKVYTLLTINFAITIGISCAFAYIIPVRDFLVERKWIIYIAIGVAIVSLLILACIRLAFPTNLILMYVFVISFSVMIGVIVATFFDKGWGFVVLQAFIATAVVFLTITAYIFVTKKDFSFLYGFLGAALVVLIVLSLFSFLLSYPLNGRSRAFYFGISLLGTATALVMTGYLLFDTSMIITRYGPDQWLPAVISLYVDVTTLFLYLLNIFSFISN